DPRGAFSHNLIGVTIGGRYYPYVYGASISGPIWKDSMIAALKGVEPAKFHPPDRSRFGGCSSKCGPRPTKEDAGNRGIRRRDRLRELFDRDRARPGDRGGRGRGGGGDFRNWNDTGRVPAE